MQTKKKSDPCLGGGVGTGTHQASICTYMGSGYRKGGGGENRLLRVRTAESRKSVGGWLLDANARVVA